MEGKAIQDSPRGLRRRDLGVDTALRVCGGSSCKVAMAARLVGIQKRADHTSAADPLIKLNPSNLISIIEKTSSFNVQPHDLTGEDVQPG